jgi:flavodoxin
VLAVALLTTYFVVTQHPAQAADPQPAKATSLAMIPANATFYTSTLRLKEQIDLFYKSRAYKTLRSMPSVKQAYDQVMAQLKDSDGGSTEMIEQFMQSELGKKVTDVLTEAASDEIFAFGGGQWSNFMRLLAQVNQAQTAGSYGAMLQGSDPNVGQGRAILRTLMKNRAQLKVPELVIGFRLATPDKASKLLKQAAVIAEGFAAGQQEIEDRFKVKKIGDGEFMTLELDGSLIPWEQVDLTEVEEKRDEFKDLIDHIKKMKLTVSLGVSNNYLLLSLGESTKDLEAFLGKGKKLIDLVDVKPIVDAGAKRFTSLGYLSKEFVASAGGTYADSYGEMIRSLKESLKTADLSEERKKSVAKLLDEVQAEVQAAPKIDFGSSIGYAYLTNIGYEIYSHDRTQHPSYDKINFKMHEHWGGNPIFATSFGCFVDGETYKSFVTFAKKGFNLSQEFLSDYVDAETLAEIKKTIAQLTPTLEKLDKSIANTLIPAMKQSGLGIVVDGKWKSKSWINFAPPSDKEMPMLELGLLIGVSDAKKFDQGCTEVREILNELLEKLSDVPNAGIPAGLAVPAPTKGEGLYWWEIPTSPLDEQVVPTVGTGKAASVLTFSKKHAARLIKPTPLTFRTKELAFSGPVLGACVLDWVGFVELVAPWIEQGVAQTARELEIDAKISKRWMREAQLGLDIAKCFKGATCTTTKAPAGVIHKTVIVVKDLEVSPDPID